MSTQPVHQMYKPSPASIGAVAARGLDTNWQMDVASLVQLPAKENDDYRYILLAVNVFDRMCFAEPLKTQTPQDTAEALKRMLSKNHKPEILSTDDAGEFQGAFAAVLSTQGIIHKIKDSDDRNAIAVVDRTTRNIKDALFKQMVVKGVHTVVGSMTCKRLSNSLTIHLIKALKVQHPMM